MMHRKLALSLIAAVALSGCVSASKHKRMVDDLEAQLATERSSVEAEKQNVSTLEQKLLNNTKDRAGLRASLDEMKKAMDEMKARQAEQKKRLEEFQDLTRRFKKLTDSGALSVKIIDGKMVVSLGSDLLFPAGSARLSKEGMQAVKEVAQQLASIPGKKYQVEGHTDNIPIKSATFPSNWELASARAITVLRTMADGGLDAARVSAASFGDTSPVQPNDTAEGRAANRRVAIVVVPDLSSLPGYADLQKMSQ
jgi:chemotaxis protein MotB